MKIKKRHIRIPVNAEDAVHAFVMEPARKEDIRLTVVFSHGFTVDGTESARHFLALAEAVCACGWRAMLFDYRGSGYSDLAFTDMTFDTEAADLSAVLGFARNEYPDSKICAWGESLGTAVIAHAVAAGAIVEMAVMWSLSADLYRRYQERYGQLLADADYVYSSSGFKVSRRFLESLTDRDTYSAIREMRAPSLLVHGDSDDVAPVTLSRRAHREASELTTLREIPGGNHGFEAQDQQFEQAMTISLDWIKSQLAT